MTVKLFDHDGKGKGFVAIWANVWFDEDNNYIGYFDTDRSEGGSVFDDNPILDSIQIFSYGKSFAEEVAKQCERLHINSKDLNYIWILFDHYVESEAGPIDDEQYKGVHAEKPYNPLFLGNFKYSKDEDD